MTVLYIVESDGRILQADACVDTPMWTEVTDSDLLACLHSKTPMDLEEFYPVAQAAREAWEAE